MSRVAVRPATAPAVLHVAENLREADRQELEAAAGVHALAAVLRAWGWSQFAWVAEIDGIPSIVFGVTEDGCVWLAGTDAISSAALSVFRASKLTVAQLLKRYPRLHSRADCRNTLHLRWLKLMGFTFDDVVEVNGLPFQRFHMTREEGAWRSH